VQLPGTVPRRAEGSAIGGAGRLSDPDAGCDGWVLRNVPL